MASPGAPDVPDAPTRLVARLPAQVTQSPPAWSPLLCGVDTQGLRGAARCGSPPCPLRVAWARAEAGPAGAGRRQGHWLWARPGDAGVLPSLDVLDCPVGLAPCPHSAVVGGSAVVPARRLAHTRCSVPRSLVLRHRLSHWGLCRNSRLKAARAARGGGRSQPATLEGVLPPTPRSTPSLAFPFCEMTATVLTCGRREGDVV